MCNISSASVFYRILLLVCRHGVTRYQVFWILKKTFVAVELLSFYWIYFLPYYTNLPRKKCCSWSQALNSEYIFRKTEANFSLGTNQTVATLFLEERQLNSPWKQLKVVCFLGFWWWLSNTIGTAGRLVAQILVQEGFPMANSNY